MLLGQLVVKVTGDATQFDKTIDTSHKKFSGFGGKIRNISLGVGAALLGIGAAALKASADMEQQTTAFRTLLGGSEEAAKKLLGQLEELGAKTPLQLESLTRNANVILQYGGNAATVTDQLRTLGDVVQGNATKLDSMTLAFAQISAAGKANMQDIRQMINAGFNPLTVIAEKTGESMDALAKRVSAGKVSFDEINEAFKTATSEGGDFFNAMKNQSETFAGRLSTLQDNVTIMARKLGDLLLPVAGKLITVMSQLVDEISKNDEFFNSLATAIGKIGEIIVKLLPIVSKLLTAIAPIISAVANLVAILVDALFPIIELIANLFSELSPVITKVIEVIGSFIGAIGKIIAIAMKLIKPILEPLYMIFDIIAASLDPIIDAFDMFAKILGIVSDVIAPIVNFVTKIATKFSEITGTLLKLVQPLMKPMVILFNLLLAVLKPFLPILEGIGNFISDTLEGAFKLLTDALQGLADAFTWLVQQAVALGLLDKSVLEFVKITVNAKDAAESVDELTLALNKLTDQPLPATTGDDTKEEVEKIVSLQEIAKRKWDEYVAHSKEKLNEQAQDIQKYVDLGKNYFGDLFGSLGEALVTGQDGWVAFAQTAVSGIAAVIDALANEALAQAAAEFAKGIAAASSVLFAATAPGHFSASAAWAAAGAAGKVGAGIVRGLASQIKLADGGLIMPRAGGTVVTAAEAGVPEYYLPERQDILGRLADKISANMGNTTNITNNNLPGRMVLNIDGREFYATLSEASRDGKFQIDQRRGLSR